VTQEIVVLYHAECSDGFGAAWSAWKRFGDKAQYIPVRHGAPPPDGLAGKKVIIADFAYPRETLLALEKTVKTIRVLDHHETAQADIGDLSFVTFDMKRSGAGITWDTLHKDYPRPMLINYIEDRDLWKWKYDESRAILAALDLVPQTFEAWSEFAASIENTQVNIARRDAVIAKGNGILEYKHYLITQTSNKAQMQKVCGFDVPVLNSYLFRSELGAHLAKGHPFALIWFQCETGERIYSARSTLEGENVAKIAEKFGGGGHARSSGFKLAPGQSLN
jgi:oligoribonuclease NrnB/cAMP/cGMP phosphodiesterase (DHH superfamily)